MSVTPTHEKAAAPSKETAATFTKSPQANNLNDRFQALVSVCRVEAGKPVRVEREVTVAAMLEEIRSGRFSAEIGRVRTLISRLGKAAGEVKSAKLALPAYLISGRIEGRVAQAMNEGRFTHSGFLQLDFDGIADPEAFRDELITDEHVVAAWLSPSGDGVKGIAAVTTADSEDTHKAVFAAAEKHFAAKGWELDKSCKNSNRLLFAGWDSELKIREDEPQIFHPLKATEPRQPPSAPKSRKEERSPVISDTRQPLDADTVRDMLRVIPHNSYDDWLRIANAVWHAVGESEGTALLQAWSPEKAPGDYAKHFQHRLSDVTSGTLFHYAEKYGWGRVETDIPDNVFPVPAGGVSVTQAAEIIFAGLAGTQKMFMRGTTAHEVGRSDGIDYLSPVPAERFCSLVERAGKRVARKEVKTAGGAESVVWRSTTFPISSAKVLLETDAARNLLPPIRQILNCPIITPDDEILGRGYHAHEGGTFISSGQQIEDVKFGTAVRALQDLLADFDFPTASDESRAFASFVSPALKMGGGINDDFPLDLAEADLSQSGKTFRQKLVCRIYNERPSSITISKGGVGSLDEAISSALVRGKPFVTLGNIRGKVDSSIMEEALRGAGRVTCRTLRNITEVDCSPFLWQLSTNGAELTRDLANRAIVTRIRKRPSGYEWKQHPEGDLENHVIRNQGFYLSCVFTILREWNRQGHPITTENRHDFRGWCRAMDGIVQMCGMQPLLDGHREQQLRTANPGLQWLRDVLLAMKPEHHGYELATYELANIAEDSAIAFPGNPQSKDDPPQRAGKLLAKIFRDAEGDEIAVDGFTFTRTESPDYTDQGRGRTIKKYTTRKP